MYSLTCFGRPHAHYQELNNCSSSLWFYRWSLVVAGLLVVVGQDRLSVESKMAPIQHKIFCVRKFIKTESQLTLLHGCALGERSSGGI